ncbi:iron uptake porin [Planktothrix pseudagardhii]|uniref:SLH domain-containing protein n=1 Tax=Planktothrix pseudagardhii TaxID=132604 RepID=A0A9W4G9H8_9CYAN|nr:iron uptake porin [Planktothrix pseudagardhii]CAD5981410.1 putative protein alr4550 [Planktothrix pseudagardhii]
MGYRFFEKVVIGSMSLAMGLNGYLTVLAAPEPPIDATKSIQEQIELADLDNNTETNDGVFNVTSVSYLSDVNPGDWAFQALQSLVERYGCITGYEDNRYQGDRVLTRFEFAAGLNACLSRINEVIAANTGHLISLEDLTLLQKLQEQFAAELSVLNGHLTVLEARIAEVEANQFSTTTKLTGEAITTFSNGFSGLVDGNNIPVVQHRVRLNFRTSFTGQDTLYFRMFGGNAPQLALPGGSAEGLTTVNLTYPNDEIRNGRLAYSFPVNSRLSVNAIATGGVLFDLAPTLSPFLDSGTSGSRALSEFASSSPIYRIGGGAGMAANYQLNPQWIFSLAYLASNARNAGNGEGLFNGEYTALTQIRWSPKPKFGIGLTYVNAYKNRGAIFDFGTTFPLVGTLEANKPFPHMITNSYGLEGFYQFSPHFAMNAYLGYTQAKNSPGNGNADIWYYAVGLAFPDIGKEGNLGGLVIGAEPYRSDNPPPANDVPFHIEAFYKYRLNDYIAITPGLIWLTAPAQNNNNDDAVIGIVRTTFTF